MRIAIVAPSPVPFIIGGAENLWLGLLDALNNRPGVLADLIKLPSPERNMGELLASYRRFSELDLDHFDLVISTKYPAWAIRHRNHVVYLQHTLRGLYDCYPADLPADADPGMLSALGLPPRIVDALVGYRAADVEFDEVLDALDAAYRRAPASRCWAFPGPVTRAAIRLLDAIAMRPDKIVRHAGISRVVARRDGYFPRGIDVAVHHHPTGLKGLAAGPQRTVFSASRLDPAKRIDLIIDAYKASGIGVPLHIAGSGPDEARLRTAAAGHPGIRFLGRLPEAELAREYANAICVPFVPRDEDYGLITLEAMLAAKPVLTTTDSGGPLELIEDGRTGVVVPPEPAAIAKAMRGLCENLSRAREMGIAAQADANRLNWNTLCDALLDGLSPRPVTSAAGRAANGATTGATIAGAPAIVTGRAKPLLGVLNTYPIAPVISGGKLRLHALYSRLADRFHVRFVNLAPARFDRQVRALGADFDEELVPKTLLFTETEARLEEAVDASVEDLTAAMHPETAPEWLDAIDALARRADLMVCSHPYTMPALRAVSDVPFVYEAHNVEADVKQAIYGPHRWALDQITSLERRAVLDAALVTTCSNEDRERMRTLYGSAADAAKLIVVPNGADTSAAPIRDASRMHRARAALGIDGPIAIFVGSAHGPNVDAARVVFDAATRLPDVRFVLLGSVCDAVGTWARPANVGLAGVVTDAEKARWLDVCDIGLNPMVSGSGTNLKLLEYAATGVPFVSTAFGARGLGFDAGRDYADADAATFAEGIRSMLERGQDAREAMALNARRRVEAAFDWTSIARAYGDALTDVLA
ncbi:glycosyltransferase family 4 protein [Burkholderia guangdongensis]|uniref:glycosyltransferase family 4 protein n=1 Tax=Burkholderia guangdongensis TaxID=1792500 RepID=UPI0015CD1751|nr:glycosyltransferase [Burkholderia guangdongensis]